MALVILNIGLLVEVLVVAMELLLLHISLQEVGVVLVLVVVQLMYLFQVEVMEDISQILDHKVMEQKD